MPEVKFSLTRGDSQISFKGLITKGDLVYRQYCLLPAPKHIKKIKISYFTGATRFPYYISISCFYCLSEERCSSESRVKVFGFGLVFYKIRFILQTSRVAHA